VLTRPLDLPLNQEIVEEAQVVKKIIEAIFAGDLILVDSESLSIESLRIPEEEKKEFILSIRSWAKIYSRAKLFVKNYCLGSMDAIHLACAEKASATFLTVDKRLLKKAKRINLQIDVMNPIDFWRCYGGKRINSGG
jgi:predicted nucleic acid-binding protein